MPKIDKLNFKTYSLYEFFQQVLYLFELSKINSFYLKDGLQNKIGPYLSFLLVSLKIIFSSGSVFICHENNQVLGGLISFKGFCSKSNYFVDCLALKNIAQQKGIGSNLLIENERYLFSKRKKKICIYIKTLKNNNQKVQSFYLKNGYLLIESFKNKKFVLFSKVLIKDI